ncbi:MAG: phosphatase [Bacteroidales bacterium]|nr:phosphatase [Bacteroidales bacterium]MCB9013126.1 phosphatase [Bacteroidales bacterium]
MIYPDNNEINRVAILDFGTNTFNLLIAEISDENKLHVLHTAKEAVKLGEGGITKKIITEQAFERGLTAIERHLERVREYNVHKIYAFATSAIRDASNGKDFIHAVQQKFEIYVLIIPGEREAEMIYRGVRLSFEMDSQPVLILDIGGGSNEFIIANKKEILWKHSFNLGMARLLETFNPSDPISKDEIQELESYLKTELKELFEAAKKFKPKVLVGASGSFETISALIQHRYSGKYKKDDKASREISYEDYQSIHNLLLPSSIEERRKMQGMEPVRVEMIVLASIFINISLSECGIQKIIQSDYALKEGVIAEILNL